MQMAENIHGMDKEAPGVKNFLLEMVAAMSTDDPVQAKKNIHVIAVSIRKRLEEQENAK